MTHRLLFNPHLHTTQTFRVMVEALSVPPHKLPALDLRPVEADDPPPPFEPAPAEVERARDLLRQAAAAATFEPLVLLNCNCSDLLPLRRWPSRRYVELAGRLIERFPDLRVGMTGAPSEGVAVAALVGEVNSPRCFSLAGRTTLRELLVIYTLAEVLVTNDSGPAHFAALTPIDVITIFGPEHPKLFAARSPRNHVMWEGIACSPCVSAFNNRTSPCRDNVCMQRVDVNRVFELVCRLVDARSCVPVT
jgi:ADP-heptose:LPS heptosyltransferase